MVTKFKKANSQSRQKTNKDHSPTWDGAKEWDGSTFSDRFRTAMEYYRLESSVKDLKIKVIEWMQSKKYDSDTIKAMRKIKDKYFSSTMVSVAACLVKGMPEVHLEFNDARDTGTWLRLEIDKVLKAGSSDVEDDETLDLPMISVQQRLRDASLAMTDDIEDALENFYQNPEAYDPKQFKVLNALKQKQAKAAHARIIKDFYQRTYNELQEAATYKDDQLKEGYSHLTKNQLKKLLTIFNEIITACEMLMQEAKINRRPKKSKAVSKEKLVSKLKYLKQDDKLKIISINPIDIIGSKELWIFNTKTRKLGKYTATEFQELSIKGTAILGFDESKSIQKTLRKPEEQLKEFKSAGKVALRSFMNDIKSVDIKLNGRINQDTLLLKVQ